MLKTLSVLAMATLFAATGCKKEDKGAPKSDPAAKPADPATKPTDPPADKPADPVAKPAEPAADKPADKPAEPAATGPTWEKFTSKEGGFVVELPGKAEERDVGNGMKMAAAQFGTTASDDRAATCGAPFMNLPDGAKDAKTMLEASAKNHKATATVVEEKDIKLDKHPGKHLVVKNDKHQKWIRTYIVDKRIYVVNCGGPFDRAGSDGPIATKVLESFALAK